MRNHKKPSKSFLTKILCVLTILALFACSAKKIDGTGAITVEKHLVQEFEKINIGTNWNAILMQGDSSRLVVKANQNLHKTLSFYVKGNTLHILSEKRVGKAGAKTILIYHTEDLEEITASDGAKVNSNPLDQKSIEIYALDEAEIILELDVKNLSVRASDNAVIQLSGESKNVNAWAENGASVNAKGLKTQNANTTTTNNGSIIIKVEEVFIAEASEGGTIEYYGNPKTVSIQKQASGSVIKK